MLSNLFSPYLHAFAPRAHVFSQEEVIERHRPNDVEHLLDNLLDQLWIHPMLTHDGVKGVQLSDDRIQGIGPFIRDAGGPLSQASRLYP